MILYIDTTDREKMFIALLLKEKQDFKVLAYKSVLAWRKQSEKLLPSIDKLLLSVDSKIKDVKKIIVNNNGGSFTSLRIGVITANALGFALKIPVYSGQADTLKKDKIIKIAKLETQKKFSGYYLVEPIYSSEPNIGIKQAC